MIKRAKYFFGFIVVFTEIKADEIEFKGVTAAGQLILAVPTYTIFFRLTRYPIVF